MDKESKEKLTIDEFRQNLKDIALGFEDSIRDIGRINIKKLNACEDRLNKVTRDLERELKKFDKIKRLVDRRLKANALKMESIEDTFFTLYHNLNARGYGYFEDMENKWNDYLDLKKHYHGLVMLPNN